MGLECCGHQEENPAILERARALQEAGREILRKSAKVGNLAVSRIHSGFLQMFTRENPEPGGEVGWAGVSCPVMLLLVLLLRVGDVTMGWEGAWVRLGGSHRPGTLRQ